jgi:hypothetical protein
LECRPVLEFGPVREGGLGQGPVKVEFPAGVQAEFRIGLVAGGRMWVVVGRVWVHGENLVMAEEFVFVEDFVVVEGVVGPVGWFPVGLFAGVVAAGG